MSGPVPAASADGQLLVHIGGGGDGRVDGDVRPDLLVGFDQLLHVRGEGAVLVPPHLDGDVLGREDKGGAAPPGPRPHREEAHEQCSREDTCPESHLLSPSPKAWTSTTGATMIASDPERPIPAGRACPSTAPPSLAVGRGCPAGAARTHPGPARTLRGSRSSAGHRSGMWATSPGPSTRSSEPITKRIRPLSTMLNCSASCWWGAHFRLGKASCMQSIAPVAHDALPGHTRRKRGVGFEVADDVTPRVEGHGSPRRIRGPGPSRAVEYHASLRLLKKVQMQGGARRAE